MPGSNTMGLLSSHYSGSSEVDYSRNLDEVNIDDVKPDENSSSFLSTLGSILGVISSPISSVINWLTNSSENEKRNKSAIEQWMRENEYNKPVNQVARLKAAGLNPALMYENGASGLISAQSPEMSKPTASFQGIDPLAMSQIKLNNASASELESRIPEHEKNVQKMDADIRSLDESVEMMKSQGKLFNNEAVKSALECTRIAHTLSNDVKLSNLRVESEKIRFVNDYIKNEYLQKQLDAGLKHIYAIVNNLNADAAYKRELISTIKPHIAEMKQNLEYIKALTEGAKAHNEWIDEQELMQIITGYVNGLSNGLSVIPAFKSSFAPVKSK